mmetsp:Transcript_8214/g.10092  ORF Transcript_8214/g.10092 Transcript_8214/m.10092 type:complete len:546 (-) Transcript_8214:308-1945(-)|eukprot:CAMPEP_0172515056 /NCGR_PEP_ID=MMETSP1066-20121228/264860_1 /TAXON_ID=671091 /ORGANISM="Coscinodiscus wailesii, Strain CCMP2513" /LENGTH=545 /DNA_ID=CAMNT_0013295973 /DNA_START=216 /DNA_END=1853 /DNA_ORIENTATION=-
MSSENITLIIRLGTTIRFTIPSTSSNNITITVNSTIQDVKSLIALEEACDRCPVERQRLIYKGRILSDDSRTLSDYGVAGDNQTLHLVKGNAPRGSTAPSPSHAPVPSSTTPSPSNPVPPMGGAAGGGNAGLFNMMQNMMQQNNGSTPDFSQMQQQLLQNPEMMSSLMSSPMMQSMMSNPDVVRMMMESNPEMRRVLDSNPQLRHILDDPELMRRSMEMMRDPSAMQNMMRNQDLAMSQIENVPGGFNALRRMYEEVQEPMMDAMTGAGSSGDSNPNPADSNASSSTGGAMPNPWGAPSTTPAPSPAFNPWGAANPLNPGAGGGTAPNPPWTGGVAGQNPLGSPNLEQTISMLENPVVNNMMQQMLSDPAALQAMMENNPMLAQMRQANPAAAAMMSQPETLRTMMDPTNLRAMMQMQQAMQTLQGNGLAIPGMPPVPDMSSSSNSSSGASPAAGNLDFSGLLQSMQNANLSGTTPPAMPQQRPPEERFRVQLASLNDMGFNDQDANIRALSETHGNVNRAVERLLNEPPTGGGSNESGGSGSSS